MHSFLFIGVLCHILSWEFIFCVRINNQPIIKENSACFIKYSLALSNRRNADAPRGISF